MGDLKIEKTIEKRIKKVKKTCKQICCCTFWWLFLGLAILVIAIVLLVHFAKFWGDEEQNSKRIGAIIGVVFIFLGLFMMAVGITCCVLLAKYYRKMNSPKDSNMHSMFKPPTFPPGKAPYPQQPEFAPPAAQVDPGAAAPMIDPSAPPAPGHDSKDVHVDVSTNDRF